MCSYIYNKNNTACQEGNTITILTAKLPLVKTYRIIDNKIHKEFATKPKSFDSEVVKVNDIRELHNIIQHVAHNINQCIIRSPTENRYNFEVQRKLDKNGGIFKSGCASSWICFDFDERIVPEFHRNSLESINWLIEHTLPPQFHNASYVLQWSGSAGLVYGDKPAKVGTNAHIFFWLSQPLTYEEMNYWFKEQISDFRNSKGNGIDPSTFRDVGQIHISSQVIKDEAIEDEITEKVIFVKKDKQDVCPYRYAIRDGMRIEKQKSVEYREKNGDVEVVSKDILVQVMNELGAITELNKDYMKLKHPEEKTQGDWFWYFNNESGCIGHSGGQKPTPPFWWVKRYYNQTRRELLPKIINTGERTDDIITDIRTRFKKKYMPDEPEKPLIEMDEPEFVEPTDRAVLKQRLENFIPNLTLRTLIYGTAGSGKSYLAFILNKKGERILFATTSNEQAEEKFVEFKKEGINAQLVVSREYRLRKLYGFEATMKPPQHPFDAGSVDEKKTKQDMMRKLKKSKSEVDRIWNELKPELPNWHQHDFVITTQTRAGVWGRIQKINKNVVSHGSLLQELKAEFEKTGDKKVIPNDVIIFYDDPDHSIFDEYAKHQEKFEDKKVYGEKLHITEIENKKYFIRPEALRVGFGIENNKIIFTTTEVGIEFQVRRKFNTNRFDLTDDGKINAGNLVVVSTDIVRMKNDVALPIISHRLKKEGYDHVLFGDGFGTPLNHLLIKGRNDLADKDVIAKLSCQNQGKIKKYCHELGSEIKKEGEFFQALIVYDQFNQAMRNQGYRYKGKQCIILIDPKLFKFIVETSEYHITQMYRITDRLHKFFLSNGKEVKRLNIPFSTKGETIEHGLMWYIVHLDEYLRRDKRKMRGDILGFLSEIKDQKWYNISKRMRTFFKEKNLDLPRDIDNLLDEIDENPDE